MPHLPARADLDQLRSRAKELLQAAQRGDPEATARLRTVSDRLALSAAQLVIALEYGFASWAQLKIEIERRAILDSGDWLGWPSCSPNTPNWPSGGWCTGATIPGEQAPSVTWP